MPRLAFVALLFAITVPGGFGANESCSAGTQSREPRRDLTDVATSTSAVTTAAGSAPRKRSAIRTTSTNQTRTPASTAA